MRRSCGVGVDAVGERRRTKPPTTREWYVGLCFIHSDSGMECLLSDAGIVGCIKSRGKSRGILRSLECFVGQAMDMTLD